jgi:hypothetical protein
MADFKRVPVERPLPPNWLPTLGWMLAIGVTVAVVKPWDLGGAPPPPSQQPTAVAAGTEAPPPRSDGRRYDPRLFGGREPDPKWELWPAGYVVFFGIAGPVRVDGQDAPDPSDRPRPSPSPGLQSPPATPDPGDGFVVDLGPADHLIALGINTPLDVRVVDVRLWAADGGRCCGLPVSIVRLETLWESDHFTVIGVEDPVAAGEAGPWPSGEYRLELVLADRELRMVRLHVDPPTG